MRTPLAALAAAALVVFGSLVMAHETPWPGAAFPARQGGSDVEDPSAPSLAHVGAGYKDDGPLTIDLAAMYGSVAGARDDDGNLPGTANAQSDLIQLGTELGDEDATVALGAAASVGDTVLIIPHSVANDEMFNRCSLTPFDVCSVDADCTAGTCGTNLTTNATFIRQFVLEIPSCLAPGVPCYERIGPFQNTGANNAGNAGLTLIRGLRRAAPSGSVLAPHLHDDLHHNRLGGAAEVFWILRETYEAGFPAPLGNLLPNGRLDDDCSQPLAGWSGTATPVQKVFDPDTQPDGAGVLGSAFRGSACYFNATANQFREWSFTATPETWYSCHGMVNTSASVSGASYRIEPRTSADAVITQGVLYDARTDALPTPEANQWELPGWATRGWTRVALEFFNPAGNATAKLRPTFLKNGNFNLDDWVCYPSIDQAPGLQYMIPNAKAGARFFLLGDSRMGTPDQDFSGGWDAQHETGLGPRFPVSFVPVIEDDYMIDHSQDHLSGRSLEHVVNATPTHAPDGFNPFTSEEYWDCNSDGDCQATTLRDENSLPVVQWRGPKPAYLLVKLGRNDLYLTDDDEPQDVYPRVTTICNAAEAVGIRCIYLTEPAHQGTHNVTTGEKQCDRDGGTNGQNLDNCGYALDEYNRHVVYDPGIGWQ